MTELMIRRTPELDSALVYLSAKHDMPVSRIILAAVLSYADRADESSWFTSESALTSNYRERCREAYGDPTGIVCYLCGEEIESDDEADADHLVPRSFGGTDKAENLRWTHASCNRSRGNRAITPDQRKRLHGEPANTVDIRAAVEVLESIHGRTLTGAIVADHFGVSPRTGRRYLDRIGYKAEESVNA